LEQAAPWGYVAEVSGPLIETLGMDDVNVVILNRAPPVIADRVARSGRVVLNRDDHFRQRRVVETKSRYCDLTFLRGLMRRALEERVRSRRLGPKMIDRMSSTEGSGGWINWSLREIPKRLLEVGILSEQLADELALAAGIRNILVHMYLEVDPVFRARRRSRPS
jgi:hypothetical protein